MQRRIEDAGFRLASRTRTVAWRADVYINARKSSPVRRHSAADEYQPIN